MAIDTQFLDEQIARKKTEIAELDAAISALVAGAQTYQLDTGQTRQSVTKAQLSQLRNLRTSVWNELSTLYARRNGASVIARPGF